MALNKKSLLVLVLLLVVAVLLYGMSAMNSKAPEIMPAVEEVAMEAETTELPEESHGHSNHEQRGEGIAPDVAASSVLSDLKEPNPLTVNPVLGVRAMGNPDASVKVTEVFSLTCSHCATFHNETYPSIKRDFIDTGKIYYVYQEFPLNAPALHASMIARCLPEERYTGFIDILFKTQDKWIGATDYKAALAQTAKLAGMSDEEFTACMANTELQQALAGVIQEASTKWEIKSTPSIVVNDGEKVIMGAQKYPAMEAALNEFVARAQSQKNELKDAVITE